MVEIDGKPYAVASDVARALGYSRPHEAVQAHCRGAVTYRIIDSLGREQEAKIIPEGDIYRLIVKAADQSKNPEIKAKAERFERWIFDEVIPSIRQHGAYMTPQKIEEILMNPDTIIELALKLKEEQRKRKEAEAQLEQQRPLVQFAETCLASKDSILVRQLAKLACKNGINIGEKRLWRKLREWGIVNKKNEPYQFAFDNGWFEVKQGVYDTPYGKQMYRTYKVTPKGQVYIIERLKQERDEAVEGSM